MPRSRNAGTGTRRRTLRDDDAADADDDGADQVPEGREPDAVAAS